MTTLTQQLADALRVLHDRSLPYADGRAHEELGQAREQARTALAAWEAAARLTNAGDWQVEPVTLTISGRPRKGRNYREPVAYVPRDILNRELIAPRIVACVNACAGIPTDALQTMPLRDAVNGVWQTAYAGDLRIPTTQPEKQA